MFKEWNTRLSYVDILFFRLHGWLNDFELLVSPQNVVQLERRL